MATPGAEAAATALRDEKCEPDVELDGTTGDQSMLLGFDGVVSGVKAAWQTVKGEYWLDLNLGLDWFGLVFVKNPNMGAIRNDFERMAATVPGFVELLTFDTTLDRASRTLTAAVSFSTDVGLIFGPETITLSPNGG